MDATAIVRLGAALLWLGAACGGATGGPAPGPREAADEAADGSTDPPRELAAEPGGCSADRPCEPAAPYIPRLLDRLNCGPAGCSEIALDCSTDASCEPGWECLPADEPSFGSPVTGQCTVRACTVDADCQAPTTSCVEGRCTPRPCQRDEECAGGYCLSTMDPDRGECWSSPGVCSTWAPRP